MNKDFLFKTLKVFLMIIVIRMFIIISLNYINISITNVIDVNNNVVEFDNDVYESNHVCFLKHNESEVIEFDENGNRVERLSINSTSKSDLSMCIYSPRYKYQLYINDEIKLQNMNENEKNFKRNYSDIIIDLNQSDYQNINGENIAKIKLLIDQKYERTVPIYISPTDVQHKNMLIKMIFNTIALMIFLVVTVLSLILYLKNRKNYYLLILVFIGMISLFKTIVWGEFNIISEKAGVDLYHFIFYDNSTTVLNILFPIIIMYDLFDIKIKKKHLTFIGIGLTILVFMIPLAFNHGYIKLVFVVYLFVIALDITVQLYAYFKDKEYSTAIIVLNSIYFGFIFYSILGVAGKLEHGYLTLIFFPAQFGAVIYSFGLLVVLISSYLKRLEMLKKKETEYKRIELLRGITHDLRVPLSVIKSSNQIMNKYEITNDEKIKYTERALAGVDDLDKMTENINVYLNINEVLDDKSSIKTSVKSAFERLKQYFGDYAKDKNIEFEVILDTKDCMLDITENYFNRMLYNLVDNAFKYNNENGSVVISYKIWNNILEIIIEDTGIGMTQEESKKVFDYFYRADYSRTTQGFGLGLPIVKSLLEKLKGDIRVESKKNIGTKIYLSIPIS